MTLKTELLGVMDSYFHQGSIEIFKVVSKTCLGGTSGLSQYEIGRKRAKYLMVGGGN